MTAVRLRHQKSLLFTTSLLTLGLVGCQAIVAQDAVETNKTDLVFAVDASTLRDGNRAQVEQSIQSIVNGLQSNGKDVRYAVFSAGTAGVAPGTVPVGGGTPQGFDIFSNLFGIFGGGQFMMPGWSSGLPTGGGLPPQVTQGYAQLFPILSQITNMSGSGASQSNIFSSLLPMFSGIFSQQMQGSTNSGLNQQLLTQLIQSAMAGQSNGMSQDQIIASLAPQLLAMLQGGGLSSGQGNMASLLLPALMQMYGQSQSGGQIDQAQIAQILMPILMSQISGGNFGGQNPLSLLGFIFPLMQNFTGMDKTQIQNMAVALAPLAVAYFSGGSGTQYAPIVQAMIPVLFQAMGNGSNGNVNVGDTAQLLGTPGITSLLSAFAGGGPLADGFLRNDSAFSVIYLGDQMNIGDSTQASALAHTFLQNLSNVTKRDLGDFSFSSINMNQSASCVGPSANSSKELAAVLSQRTSGVLTDLCGIQQVVDLLSH